VTNVANNNGFKSFTVLVDPPPGIDVVVTPSTIKLKPGQSATYEVTFTATSEAVVEEWAFGSLTWTHGGEYAVRSPIAVKPIAFAAPAEVSGTGTDGSLDFDVQFGYDGVFTADPEGLVPAEVQPDSVAEGDNTLHFVYVPPGSGYARFSLFDSNVGDGTGSDDLDLQVQGPDTAGYPLVGTSGSATSNEEVNVPNPLPGWYAVFVIHYATVNPVTAYDLFAWSFGPDEGNMTVTAPPTASIGSGNISVDWSGLTPATKYLGGVLFTDGVMELDRTVVNIETP